MVETRWTRFAGANIKGTPSMSADKVAADVMLLRRNSSVMVLQEFRWPWYWTTLAKSLRDDVASARRWRSAPGMAAGVLKPVFSGQAIAWRGSRWKSKGVRRRKLHDGMAGISETRWLRAALLADREHEEMQCWFATTHFVVGGDEESDGPKRKMILDHDIQQLHGFLRQLRTTGQPVIFQGDFNIHRGTWAFRELMAVLRGMGCRTVGDLGVEYLFVMDAHCETKVEIAKDWIITPKRLNTDHEVRGMTFRLVRP